MPPGATESGPKAGISKHGLFVILASTAIALLGTPLASPAMPEIARVFAENAQNELFARAILRAISVLARRPQCHLSGQVHPVIDPCPLYHPECAPGWLVE